MLAKLQARKQRLVQLNVLVADELRDKLRKAAKKNGASLNGEAAARLGGSFAEAQAFGGEAGRRWLHFLATAFVVAGENYYRNRINPKHKTGEGPNVSLWIDEPEAYAEAMMNVIEQLMFHQPGVTYEKCIAQHDALHGIIFNHFRGQAGWVKPELNKEGGK
jgi:hypothetical protein